jgi:hypothetical protein
MWIFGKYHWITMFIIALLIAGCLFLTLYLRVVEQARNNAFDFVDHSLRIGQPQEEVSEILNRVGPYEIISYPPGSCRIGSESSEYQRKYVLVYGQWRYLSRPINIHLCIDKAGRLAYYQMVVE